jgi:hypothetical protein
MLIHNEKSHKMQQRIEILLFYVYVKLNMFRASRRSKHAELHINME